MLKVENIVTRYGAIEALKGMSLDAQHGEVTCLLGPNGAGKTTTMFTIAGILSPHSGSITLDGNDLTHQSAPAIVRKGISLVPENRLVFPEMSVADNLAAGAYCRSRSERTAINQDLAEVFDRFPQLKERREQLGGTLSGGEQQMLAIGRALMARPKILMMDEPSLGLAPLIVDEIFKIIQQLNQEGVTILLVEQNARMALKVAHKLYLLEQGAVTFEGSPTEMQQNELIQRAYLGAGAD
ncbi:MAG TPA: ABC transporter ATP-binding protein [Gammaproteobacteria bacterium]|jgi:branched-chain amino acid transport system ATP-binding protein|nr:MAG: ABC transporter ATP-binding protein [Rhodospirillaceae bacterium]HBK74849.1 ABC transporter ATP-binding protein [Gammaproteobacteria bacterium]HHZ72991.1 ABC transporter ATP-binding protein [Gammaproteobacteria bacterium]HIA41900.1 ABC transporter ATP-binding protein [Gammaproteobacteria bacterium]HIB06410.1 ABC transporter ATP-binding protein [Gammaproteobacteria bacterium]|tara:strand:- start:147 stop:866 length:720 start_codon:yes stop_codon:yes gene_type:complete